MVGEGLRGGPFFRRAYHQTQYGQLRWVLPIEPDAARIPHLQSTAPCRRLDEGAHLAGIITYYYATTHSSSVMAIEALHTWQQMN